MEEDGGGEEEEDDDEKKIEPDPVLSEPRDVPEDKDEKR